MALTKCTECNREISDKAETCPHCGCPSSSVAKATGPACPQCKGTNLSAGDKGFGLGKAAVGGLLLGPVGLLGGLFGSKKTTVTCLSCGHKWTLN